MKLSKITKKQWIIGGAVALLLAGGTGGAVIHHNNVEAQKKTELKAKTAYEALVNEAEKAVTKSEKFESYDDLETAQKAIEKLKEDDKDHFIDRSQIVCKTWDVIKEADKAVKVASKTKKEADIKTAQKALDKIKLPKAKAKKAILTERLTKVQKAVAKKKAKVETEKKKAEEAQAKSEAPQEKATQAHESSSKALEAKKTPNVPQGQTQAPQAPQAGTQTPQAPQATQNAPVQVAPSQHRAPVYNQAPAQTPQVPQRQTQAQTPQAPVRKKPKYVYKEPTAEEIGRLIDEDIKRANRGGDGRPAVNKQPGDIW